MQVLCKKQKSNHLINLQSKLHQQKCKAETKKVTDYLYVVFKQPGCGDSGNNLINCDLHLHLLYDCVYFTGH